jgi:hypothetical protein
MNSLRNIKLCHYSKEQDMQRIKHVLKKVVEHELPNVRESYKHREPTSVKRKSYLRVEFEKDPEGCEDGYAIEYDPCTLELTQANWFSTKNGIYQEIPLSKEELRALDKYYHFSDDLPYHIICENI